MNYVIDFKLNIILVFCLSLNLSDAVIVLQLNIKIEQNANTIDIICWL